MWSLCSSNSRRFSCEPEHFPLCKEESHRALDPEVLLQQRPGGAKSGNITNKQADVGGEGAQIQRCSRFIIYSNIIRVSR